MGKFAEGVPEHMFIQIPEQVEGFHANVGSLQSSCNPATVLIAVNVSGSTTNEGFVHFDFAVIAAHLEDRAVFAWQAGCGEA